VEVFEDFVQRRIKNVASANWLSWDRLLAHLNVKGSAADALLIF
jgi:hypothetical protein